MRINSINSAMPVYKNVAANKVNSNNSHVKGQMKVISMSQYMNSSVSFRGRNKEQVIFYGAEVAPYSKAGGVGVVMKDYGFLLDPKDEVVVSPYYNASVDKKTGKVTPLKDEDGDYVLLVGKDKIKLDLIAEKTMQWGKKENNKIMLFNIKDDKDKVHYFVFDEATAHYKKPYEGGAVYASGSKSETNEWNGDPYARHSKAFVELLPELIDSKKDFNPATVVCSDSQTALTHEYMVQKAVTDKDYDEIKTTHVGHNLGPGYCGETSMQNMFVNLGATPKQIEMIEKDPLYKQGILGDKYFEPFVKETIDETGTASATQIALHHASKDRANGEGFVKSFSVVAEDYADSIANNPQTAYNIYNTANDLYKDGIFNGILNPLEDNSVDPTKKLPNARYNEDCVEGDKTYPAFDLYPENASYDEMRKVKNANKLKLLERLSAEDSTIITGNNSRTAAINPEAKGIYDGPVIRPELIEMIKNGEGDKVPLFVSWGRIDTQKGHDISLEAFKEFAKTEEGKNAIFILGAGFDKGAESKRIEQKVAELLKDPDLQGRLVHIEGWAPAYAMSSAGDAAVFTSRFEPCGLTDIEAMKYYCSPIVTNTQGFKQKNFDPRLEAESEKATSLKTQHEFDLLKSQVDLIVDAYVNMNLQSKDKVKAEFPIFKKVINGVELYDDAAFVKFADEYKEFINDKKASLEAEFGSEENFPKGWNDWDELSKNYAFKYTGFARDLKDTILAKETAEAMKAYVNLPTETKTKMFENLKALDTGWKGNASLHPETNKSSFELYRERHMLPEYSAPTKADIIAKDDSFIEGKIEARQNDDMKSRIGAYLVGALTGLGGLLLSRTKETVQTKGQDELKQQVANLQKQLADKEKTLTTQIAKITAANKKNMAIVGVIAAIGGAVVSFIGSKMLMNKKTEQQPQAATNVNTTEAKTETTKANEQPVAQAEEKPQAAAVATTSPTPAKTETNLLANFNKLN